VDHKNVPDAKLLIVPSQKRAQLLGLRSAKNQKGKRTRGRKAGSVAMLPPVLNATQTFKHTSRFLVQTAGVNQFNVTANNLAGAFGCVCYVANTTARAVVGTLRIIRVTCWPSQDQSAIANVTDIRWSIGPSGNIGRDTDMIENLPLGITSTKPVVFVPPRHSLAGDWMQLGAMSSTTVFSIEASEGSIIDMTYEATLSNNTTGATIALSGVTAAVGIHGYTPLNGSGGGLLPAGTLIVF
jgi:hypothetical protein